MNSDKRILSSESLQNLRFISDNRKLIDQSLLKESEKYVSLDRQSVKLREANLESTEQIELRVKKFNELDERLKNFTKNMKKQFKHMNKHCGLHQIGDPTQFSISLNKFIETDLSVPDVDSLIKGDEAIVQQHVNNIEKMNKVMEMVKGYNYKEVNFSAADTVNESISFLREVIIYYELN